MNFDTFARFCFMNECYLLIGGNLGDREMMLKKAKERICLACGQIEGFSGIYETEPWGLGDQPHYLNQAICLKTALEAQQLLEEILQIEKSMGRERIEKYGARIIDIDILYLGTQIFESPNLLIPHPRIHERRFVLVPMAELAPSLCDPRSGLNMTQLLEQCQDSLKVSRYHSA